MKLTKSERAFHERTAKKCFNETWDYLEKKERDAFDERKMLNLAHASRYHWNLVGSHRNFAVADWQVSRVYAALNQPSLALLFAKSSLEICLKNDLPEVLPSAYEGMARAYVKAKDYSSARSFISKARQQLSISSLDGEDMKVYLNQIRETEELIVK